MSPVREQHYAVIGSGPSGMACASALLESGAKVTVIDVGRDLAPEREAKRTALAERSPREWSGAERAWLTSDLQRLGDGVPVKRLFGDEFVYSGAKWTLLNGKPPKNFGQWPSQALGGLSRVWGAALKRFDAQDLASWPIPLGTLERHYAAVEGLFAQTLRSVSVNDALPLSPQAHNLLSRWQAHQSALRKLGVKVLRASLAVSDRCQLCGMCMHGCPYGYIFSSADLVRLYKDHAAFAYRAGHIAERVEQDENGARVLCVDDHGRSTTISADRVFVAAGVLETPRLMLASFGSHDDGLTLRDSQHFLLPFLTRDANPRGTPLHTLSQLFLEIDGAVIGTNNVHVQLYTYNDFYAARMAVALGPLRELMRPLAEFAGRRFVLAQGFLHSRDSGVAHLSLSGPSPHPLLAVAPTMPETVRPLLRKIWSRLGQAGRLVGILALSPLAESADVGGGYHSGASIPMSRSPMGWQSDTLGRPRGLKRIHVADASVLPEIPSGPVTLTIMANAHRIAHEAATLDRS